jgi:hypothetical protein
LEGYAKKLYGEGSIKTSKGYTTISNHLKDYLKKKDDCLLFSDVTPEFLNLLEKYFLGSKLVQSCFLLEKESMFRHHQKRQRKHCRLKS